MRDLKGMTFEYTGKITGATTTGKIKESTIYFYLKREDGARYYSYVTPEITILSTNGIAYKLSEIKILI